MKKIIVVFINIILLNLVFAASPRNNEVFVKGSNINMRKYIKFCDKTKKIKNLYVQKYEVTRKDFEEFLDYSQYNLLKQYSKSGGLYTYDNLMPYPDSAAVLITFYDACKYCNWCSVQDGYEPVYDIKGELPFELNYFQWIQKKGEWIYYVPKMPEIELNEKANGYRLPTINEYFYLLLGGQNGIENKWGEKINISEYESFTNGSTEKVGKLKPNCLFIYDLFSNAPEWIWGELKEYCRDDHLNSVKNAIGYSPRNGDYENFNLINYFSKKINLSPTSPLERGFIGMRMVRNAK